MAPSEFRELENVIKSPLDSNEYKAIQLCNDLKIVMISNTTEDLDIGGDRHTKAVTAFKRILEFNEKYLNMKPYGEKTNKIVAEKEKKSTASKGCGRMCRGKAARGEEEKGVVIASLTIACGKMNDPVDVPGMAHFCEHAIFCGSEKYPELEVFERFLSENGGEYNARTDSECTSIYFKIFKESFEEALLMLADCVARPTMAQELVMKELKALESEYNIRKTNDDLRVIELLLQCAKDGHPCGFFGDGNEGTLNIPGIHEKLVKWKDRNYGSSFMTLVIKAPLPITKIQNVVVKIFSDIPKGDPITPAHSIAHHGLEPFDGDKWTSLYKVVPLLNQDLLKVSWYMGPEYWKNHKTKPVQYLQWLIEQKTEGSLGQYLKRKGWIFNVSISSGENSLYANNFCSGLTVQFLLTNQGFEHYVDVLKALFSYLKMLIRDHPCERLQNEFKILMADLFHYSSDRNLESPFGVEDGTYDGNFMLIKEFSEILMNHDPKDLILSKYVVSDFDVSAIASCLGMLTPKRANYVLTNQNFTPTSTGKWYGTKYSVEKPGFIEELENVEIPPEMFLPAKNAYLQESLCYPLDSEEKMEIQKDGAILKSDKAKIYYLKSPCLQGYLPTAKYFLTFNSAEGNCLLQGSWAMIDILTKCLEHNIQVRLGTALNALLNCDFIWEQGSNSLMLQIFGPSNKLPDVLEIALETIGNLDKEITPILFKNMAELAKDNMVSLLEEEEKFIDELQSTILRDRHISASRHQQFLSRVRYADFMEFCSLLKARAYVYGELFGCVTQTQSRRITTIIDSMPFRPWKGARWFCEVDHAIVLPLGERCLRVMAPNSNEPNSIIRNHYQLGKLNPTEIAMSDILIVDMDNFVLQNLRVLEGLGYVVETSLENYLSVYGFTISIITQAEKFTTAYIDERIDTVIQSFYEKRVKNLADFDKYLKPRAREGEKISWSDMKIFFERYFLPGGEESRKISLQVQGHVSDNKTTPKDTSAESIQQKIRDNRSCGEEDSVDAVEPRVDPSYPYKFLLPSNLKQHSGYFITDIQRFKNNQETYGFDAPDSPDTSSNSGEDDEDEIIESRCSALNKKSKTDDTRSDNDDK